MLKIEKEIIKLLEITIKKVYPDIAESLKPSIYLEIPKEIKFGDFSTNISMRLSKVLGTSTHEIANLIIKEIKASLASVGLEGAIVDIKAEGPGFINFYLSNDVAFQALREVLKEDRYFGCSSIGEGKRIQIEFVSANPTGPLTVAHGRQAAIGDALARLLEFSGYKVMREYFVNDEGIQIGLLGESVEARRKELTGGKAAFPENGYKGEYIYEIAKKIKERIKEKDVSKYAYAEILKGIKQDLLDFGVKFEVWRSQRELSGSGKIEKALEILEKKKFLYKKDGATWFKSSEFGDDKDRVIIKKDGSYTYVTSDIAYHKEKFDKGFEKIIDIWGPDHHGYVNRIKAAIEALGYDKERLSILIVQLVTLYRDKKPVRMSTREGEFVTLREIVDEVGRDASRFFFLMRRRDSLLDFDLELAKKHSMDNPVYYIQYAHARISSIIKFSGGAKPDIKNLHLLDRDEEIAIIKTLIQYPGIILSSGTKLEPYILLAYLQNLAGLFHSYYDAYRIVIDDLVLMKARLALITALKNVLASGLALLGVSAPSKM